MTIWRLVGKEILHRKPGFALGLISVALAVGSLVGALTLLGAYDVRTRQILALKEAETEQKMNALQDQVRKAMLGLGFNVVILPKDQNLGDWYADDYASRYMPEEYVTRLAKSDIITVRHLLPSLQQKVKWPEMKRTIILVGTRGEAPDLHASPKKPMVQPVPAGRIVLGHELRQSLGLEVGDTVALMGREFTVHRCHAERGTKDDITAWISLEEAQELLDKKGLINAILAVECKCAWADLPKVRAEITRILPDTQVIERASKALARAEARTKVAEEARAAVLREKQNRAELRGERERFASVLVPVVMVASAAWVAFLALANVRERRAEIGILRALGLRSRQILLLFLSKAVAMGLAGGAVGFFGGRLIGQYLGTTLDDIGADAAGTTLFDPKHIVPALVMAPLLAVVASWIPAMIAARQDPADILRQE
ncbi:MAG: ABC transporter permease [Planctomycetes bacterium]|nr:ABC transporter permease [Planctomycetota bacterium]